MRPLLFSVLVLAWFPLLNSPAFSPVAVVTAASAGSELESRSLRDCFGLGFQLGISGVGQIVRMLHGIAWCCAGRRRLFGSR